MGLPVLHRSIVSAGRNDVPVGFATISVCDVLIDRGTKDVRDTLEVEGTNAIVVDTKKAVVARIVSFIFSNALLLGPPNRIFLESSTIVGKFCDGLKLFRRGPRRADIL